MELNPVNRQQKENFEEKWLVRHREHLKFLTSFEANHRITLLLQDV
jgi:hypothetical protein